MMLMLDSAVLVAYADFIGLKKTITVSDGGCKNSSLGVCLHHNLPEVDFCNTDGILLQLHAPEGPIAQLSTVGTGRLFT